MAENLKSDVKAKEAFRDELLRRGFESAQITGAPADVTATRGGETYFFEVKFTRQGKNYFGAATLTEWEAALGNEDHFWFVVAFIRGDAWVFHEYSPSQFMQMSYVPPFKIFFNVGVAADKVVRTREGSRAVSLTRERVVSMSELIREFRSGDKWLGQRPGGPLIAARIPSASRAWPNDRR